MNNQQFENYIAAHTSPVGEGLDEIYRKTWLTTIYPRQLSGPLQGKFLEMISRMIRPEKILEIGTFTGYSAVCLAKGLKSGGQLTTIEADEELEDIIHDNFKLAGEQDKIKLLIGDAITLIPLLPDTYDLIFLDANKLAYPLYYPLLRERMAPNGFMLVDNVLWNNKVIDPKITDADTNAIRRFNMLVAQDSMVEQVLLPLRDGLMLIRRI